MKNILYYAISLVIMAGYNSIRLFNTVFRTNIGLFGSIGDEKKFFINGYYDQLEYKKDKR